MGTFDPIFKNSHVATVAGNVWTRPVVPESTRVWFDAEPGVRVLVERNDPVGERAGHLVLVHGLEGSSGSGYMRSATERALRDGWTVHRCNMRGCGGTDTETATMYHAGLTADVRRYVEGLEGPVVLGGYSLGGNVALKLAGEWGSAPPDCVAGVFAVSVPVDLAACVQLLEHPANRLYQWRFVSRLRDRVRRRNRLDPKAYPLEGLQSIKTIWQFDDSYVARFFQFGSAANYYATQSSGPFVDQIRVPALIVQAQDDPMIPFHLFDQAPWRRNPQVELMATEHGGHLGFLARQGPRFWVDEVTIGFAGRVAARAGRRQRA